MKIIPIATTKSAFGNDFVNRTSRGIDQQFQQMAYSEDELIVSLSNMLKIHENDTRKARAIAEKVTQFFTGSVDQEFIEIDGTRLFQLFETAKEELPFKVLNGGKYKIDISTFRALLLRAEQTVAGDK